MWDRKELKERAKIAFKSNYWRCVLVSVIIALLIGAGGFATLKVSGSNAEVNINGEVVTPQQVTQQIQDAVTQIAAQQNLSYEEVMTSLLIVGTALAAVIAVFATANVLLKIFVWNLFEIGGDRFYTVNTETQASLTELLRGFSPRYGRNVLSLFLRSLYIALWSMLFVIPGIVKSYSYLLMPYLLAENPEMSRKEAFRLSRQLMRGNKWRVFVMDLSFLGWELLSVLTFGLLHIFYVRPYKAAAYAELYKALTTN